jgi:hypothetical protein
MKRAHLPLKVGTAIILEALGEKGVITAYARRPQSLTGFQYFVRLNSQRIGDDWIPVEREEIRAHRQDEYVAVTPQEEQ